MTQNIYDNDEFFAGYSRLPRSLPGPGWCPRVAGAAGTAAGPAWPAGCLIWAAASAGSAAGHARTGRPTWLGHRRIGEDAGTRHGRGRWMRRSPTRADLERLEFPRRFDLAYSSLALHYVENLDGLLARVRAPGAGWRLVFSVEHPIYTAPADPGWSVGRGAQDVAGRRLPGRGPRRPTGSPRA